MESRCVERLKLTMHPLTFTLFLCLFTTALLLALTPIMAMGAGAFVYVDTCPGPCFNPSDVTINVGDNVYWQHVDLTSASHWMKSSDYQGRPCYDSTFLGGDTGSGNNTEGLMSTHEDSYTHFFPAPGGDCYYRCILVAGMEGVVHVLGTGGTTTTTTTTRPTTTTTTTTTTLPNHPPTAVSLTPVNIATAPSVAQSFTAVYSDPDGWLNLSDVSLLLSGTTLNEVVHYNPVMDKFSMVGTSSLCTPGQATTISNGFLTLNCSTSTTFGSGTTLTVTFNLTPQPSLSGAPYLLIITAVDQSLASNSKTTGSWIINRPPSANSVSPMNSSTAPGTVQIFTVVYSDPDGWQNIAAANFYLSGNGGTHNEWLHYLASPNLFTMLGTNAVCTPGQATTLSNGFLTLDCSLSGISGSGTVLTVTFRVTPQAPSSGIQYNIFTAASDQAAAAYAIFAGTWQIQ